MPWWIERLAHELAQEWAQKEKEMIPPFNEALADLLEKYCHHPIEDLIVAMESALDGLRDDEKFLASAPRDPGEQLP